MSKVKKFVSIDFFAKITNMKRSELDKLISDGKIDVWEFEHLEGEYINTEETKIEFFKKKLIEKKTNQDTNLTLDI